MSFPPSQPPLPPVGGAELRAKTPEPNAAPAVAERSGATKGFLCGNISGDATCPPALTQPAARASLAPSSPYLARTWPRPGSRRESGRHVPGALGNLRARISWGRCRGPGSSAAVVVAFPDCWPGASCWFWVRKPPAPGEPKPCGPRTSTCPGGFRTPEWTAPCGSWARRACTARIRRSSPWLGSWYRPTGQGRSMPVTRTRISRCPRSRGTGAAACKCLGWPSSSAVGVAPSQTRSIWLTREGRLEPSSLTSRGPAMRSSPCLTRVSAAIRLRPIKPLPRPFFPYFSQDIPPSIPLLRRKSSVLSVPIEWGRVLSSPSFTLHGGLGGKILQNLPLWWKRVKTNGLQRLAIRELLGFFESSFPAVCEGACMGWALVVGTGFNMTWEAA